MKFTLVLENPNETIAEAELQAFALNTLLEEAQRPAEFQTLNPTDNQQLSRLFEWYKVENQKTLMRFVYNCQVLPSEEEQKERVEQDESLKCSLTKVVLSRDVSLSKNMTMFFSSEEVAKEFVKQYQDTGDLSFHYLPFCSSNSDGLSVSVGRIRCLNFSSCKTFKSILMNHFNLDEQCVDNILNMIALAELRQINEQTKNTFVDEEHKRAPLVMLSTIPTSPNAKAQKEAADATLAEQLESQAPKQQEAVVALHTSKPG